MSQETPGDGVRCDWCDALASSLAAGRLGFLCPFTGDQLCSLCMEAKRLQTPVRVKVVEREGAIPRVVELDPSGPRMAHPRSRHRWG